MAFVLIFAVLDVGAAQILKRTFSAWRFQERGVLERKYRIVSPIYHHDLAASTDARSMWGNIPYHTTTNSLGFRDDATREVPLRGPLPRLLLLGDSFTEGVGIAFDSTFAGIVATKWRDAGIEVLNGAVAGYSPAMYYRKTKYLLDELGLSIDGVLVFIDISDISNEARQYVVDSADHVIDLEAPPEPRFRSLKASLKDNSVLFHVGDAVKDVIGSRKRYALREEIAAWTFDSAAFERYGRVGAQRAVENMDRLLALLRRQEIALTVAIYPWPDQIAHRDTSGRQVRMWRQWTSANGVGFLNFFPDFIDPAEDPRKTIGRYFIPYDYHWSTEGHRHLAAALLRTDVRRRVSRPVHGVASPQVR
ncbi:MAG: SGNH/GDSL hydrolase family protein [Anaerolineae bacterium]|nr:SGNH/GDSL hydrolase family protein [Gemmatimonadaceae bacterium]